MNIKAKNTPEKPIKVTYKASFSAQNTSFLVKDKKQTDIAEKGSFYVEKWKQNERYCHLCREEKFFQR